MGKKYKMNQINQAALRVEVLILKFKFVSTPNQSFGLLDKAVFEAYPKLKTEIKETVFTELHNW